MKHSWTYPKRTMKFEKKSFLSNVDKALKSVQYRRCFGCGNLIPTLLIDETVLSDEGMLMCITCADIHRKKNTGV